MIPTDNPTLLSIDTATPACSVALLHQGVRKQKIDAGARKHTQVVLPLIDALLAEAGVKPQQLDGIVVSAGPGAFTGLRVGVAVAMGMGCAHDTPLLPISSLALLAATAVRQHGIRQVLALLDARMSQVYAGCYRVEAGELHAVGEDCLCSAEDVPRAWVAGCDAIVGAGCTYPFITTLGKPMYEETIPEAQDGFDLIGLGTWQSPWEAVDLRYLREAVVQS